jgi:predicted CopG family antitoxin
MARPKYIRHRTTVTIDREVLEDLKKLRRRKEEPLNEVIKRLVKEKKLIGY